MSPQSTEHNAAIWQRLIEGQQAIAHAEREFSLARQIFLSEGVDRVALLREALRGRDRLTALQVAEDLNTAERLALFDELIFLVSFSHGALPRVRNLILSLPRDWVLANIEEKAEPLLRDGSYDEYRRFLELYVLLDHDLALKLAQRAAVCADEDIREAGEDFLEKLKPEDGKPA